MKLVAVPLPEDIQKLKWHGDFETALRVIEKRLVSDIPECLKERLKGERKIIRLLPKEYPYSIEEAQKIAAANIKGFTQAEFQELWEENAIEWIYINGQVFIKDNFLANLIKTRAELIPRLMDPGLAWSKEQNELFLNQTIKYMKEHGGISCRFHIKSTLQLKEEAEQEGARIKVYLPIPVEYAQVKEFSLLNAQVSGNGGEILEAECVSVFEKEKEGFQVLIASKEAKQRTVCFFGHYQKGMTFQIEYTCRIQMPYLNLTAGTDGQFTGWLPEKEKDFPVHYLGEQLPHIHFSPYLRQVTAEAVGDEKDGLKKAKRIYDYITAHVRYSFVRSYFTITALVDYTAAGWKGDCGLQSLLFITMCRIAGVPARWQSGLYLNPDATGSHDWAMFYAEPYGWLFADCSFGGAACGERREFYFGNLDPYRMPSCCQFQADFEPPMNGLRHDPYDNQKGEVEYENRALGTAEFDTRHRVEAWEVERAKK